MMNAKLLSGIVATVLLISCSKPEKPDVIIIHSGRMRGNVYPLTLQNISPLQHYQYLAGYIQKVREEAAHSGVKVLVVDLGDSLTGSFAAHVTGSANMVTFFNEAGYDMVQLSNLDIQIPAPALQKLKAKVLNPFELPSGEPTIPGTTAGTKVTLGNQEIFFLSNFYGDSDPKLHPEQFPASRSPQDAAVLPLRNYKRVLDSLGTRQNGSLTLLGWMKFEAADNASETFLETLRQLRVDAILAHRVYGTREKETWQASGFVNCRPPVSLNILRNNAGFVVARLDLARDPDGKWKVLKHQLLPMTANSAAPDAKVASDIEKFAEQITAADTEVVELKQPMNEDRVLDIYMAALATLPGTQAVAYSPESIRGSWSAGKLRASEVFNSLPWTTGLVQIKLTPDQFSKLESKLFRIACMKSMPKGPIALTTSQFFVRLISRQFNIAESDITELPQKSEFDFFVDYLKRHPDPRGIGDTWIIRKGHE